MFNNFVVWLQVLQNLTELHITMLEITVTPSVPELPHPPTQNRRMCQFKYACRVVAAQLRMYVALPLTTVNRRMPYHTRIKRFTLTIGLVDSVSKQVKPRRWVRLSVGNILLGVQHLYGSAYDLPIQPLFPQSRLESGLA